jgi:hypothetical protein
MPHAVLTALFLGVAGSVAGVTGTAGEITTLVAYPALLAVGIPPLAANVTNSVAMAGSGLSSASRAAPGITGQGPAIRRWMPVSITLSLAGAVLLVVTPGSVFGRVVPFLVAAGSLALIMQPRISKWQEQNKHARGRTAVFGGLSVYNGYSGAGSGILPQPTTAVSPPRPSAPTRLVSPRVTALGMFMIGHGARIADSALPGQRLATRVHDAHINPFGVQLRHRRQWLHLPVGIPATAGTAATIRLVTCAECGTFGSIGAAGWLRRLRAPSGSSRDRGGAYPCRAGGGAPGRGALSRLG